jgi:hypothetical protein
MRVVNSIIDAVTPADDEIDLVSPYELSTSLLGSYVTLDWQHYLAIRRLHGVISRYADDRTRVRPLNILMQADAGSGKSHLVKCLAASLRQSAGAVDYNLASLENIEDLIQPLDAVRNLKVQDRLPILFLDEFDSDPSRYPLLLPLLWDGELNVGHRYLKLGKLVIVLAGSGKSIAMAMANAKSMQGVASAGDGKLVDLLSRINGGEVEIPPLDVVGSGRDRRVDKVCLTISLVHARFGETIELIPLSLLRFVAASSFKYGVRSLAHLIDLIEPFPQDTDSAATEITMDQLKFPLSTVATLRDSSLAYHVFSEDGPAAIVDRWRSCAAEKAVRIKTKPADDDIPF